MKKINNINKVFTFLAIAVVVLGCERGLSDDVQFASFPSDGDIFTDAPVGLTDEFFVSFDPAAGANPDGFGTDDNEAFEGRSSIRIDVPAPNDPNGGFIGGIFLDRGNGRDLSGFDALTFWAKSSTTATVGLAGFGTDFVQNKFAVARENIQLSTDWRKYTIPIPDPSKLIQEKGMFIFSAGSNSTNGFGFTFWIDELRFENLGTVAQPRPRIFSGQDLIQQSFIGTTLGTTGLTQTFNVEDGSNVTVGVSPSYFDFESSNIDVAFVNELGQISVIGEGTATITAQLGGVLAEGSLEITSIGAFDFAPTPTQDPSSVVSLFSDAYTDIPVSRYNSFFEPFQNTLGGVVPVGDQSIISYTDLNFVGIVFNDVIFPAEAVAPVNATNLNTLHIDINVQEALQSGDRLLLQLTNYGATETVGSYLINGSELAQDTWVSFDIPLSSFSGLTDLSRIGLLLFNSEDGPANPTISNLFIDNIYFY
ncbi:MAG: carbohydrate-binding protein [Winogradskyella sp.]|uniref:carbohydrate-binding protein n=1 Tax=Winogradskyella sp. TaxID=1883156 RepID=UPI00178DEB58|nr:carbohydrate-binding protein [Winogradskyella sp.]MBT8245045.1 carbohydrate-binding protein [Winogradskyella sp.]NNK22113.1 carbohydrate-binding protein [Winogradskyella sp.]